MTSTDAPTSPPDAPPDRAERMARVRVRRRVALAVLVVVLVLVAAVAWFVIEAYPIGGTGTPAVFEVTQGEPLSQVISAMAARGIVSSALAFRIDLALTGAPTVQTGWYRLATSESFSTAKAALAAGPNVSAVAVDTAESSREVASALAGAQGPAFATRFLRIVHDGAIASPFQPRPHASLEGLLAPGTYVLSPGETPEALVRTMVSRFTARAASVGLTPATRAHGLDAYGLVTVASIVEKEGYYARNMPRVATVVYNRLARGTPLQMDATVLYATGQDGGTVTHATESIRSPYNTYLHTGLTPSPICLPSTQALTAALHPAAGPWLFFTLIDRSGTLAFSTTFAQQLANEAIGRRNGV